MYVPIIPQLLQPTSATVVNKKIVYSDTVLPVKDLGNNLKVTSIEDVSEYSLEKCLQIIFDSNPNVTFNTIQYSKNNKKVYFYTDQEITTKVYEESLFTKHEPITSSAKILEEVKSTLLSERNNSVDCISLFHVAQLLKKLNHNYDKVKKRYNAQFESILKSVYRDSSIVIYDFDYENKILEIGVKIWDSDDYENISFSKMNNDLYITKSNCLYDEKIFFALSSALSKLYDELISFTEYKDYHNAKYNIKAVNSNFNVNISHHGVEIFVKSTPNDFELYSFGDSNEYTLKCNSSIVIEAIKNKEAEIFKRIFVKIKDCPKWCQSSLYEIRQKQLAEEQRIEEENRIIEAKKQKKLELKRKLFPFLKKYQTIKLLWK